MSDRELVIQVTAGEGEPPAMRATPGREVGPVSVGAAGAWKLSAPGVADKHAYLFYDGKRLFLQSCNSDLPAMVDGRPIPLDWTPVDAPCEIAMGDARLSFSEYQDVSVSELGESDLQSYPSQNPYGSNGGHNGALEESYDSLSGDSVSEDSGVTRIEDITDRQRSALAAQIQEAARAAAIAQGEVQQMLPDDGEAPTRIHGEPLVPAPGVAMMSSAGMAIPASVRMAAAAAAGGVSNSQGSYAASAVIQPRADAAQPAHQTGPIPPVSYPGWTGTQHLSGSVPPAPGSMPPGAMPGSMPPGSMPPGAMHMGGGGMPSVDLARAGIPSLAVHGGAMPGAFVPPMPGGLQPTPAPAGGPPTTSGKASFWKEASAPKKITLLMMPLVVMSVGIIFSDDPRAVLGLSPIAAPAKPGAKPSASASASAAASSSPVATDTATEATADASGEVAVVAPPDGPDEVPPPIETAKPAAPPPKVGAPPKKGAATDKTLERKAADALAEGRFKEAADLYEELATQFPEKTAFKEAALIMRAKAGGS